MTEVNSMSNELMEVPLEDIRPSSTNPRKHFDPAALAELQASIATSGLQTPLLVRPMFDQDDGDINYYELVAGARRLRVLELLERETATCIIREMTDEAAYEAQVIENLQRADVHPLEEAEAFQRLLETLGSIPAVAARLGKEQSYVAKCLRLMALTLHSRDALRGGLITIDHALLLARLADAEQNAALKWTLDRNAGPKTTVEQVVAARIARRVKEDEERKEHGGRHQWLWEPETVVQLKRHIEAESGIPLARAPWPLTEDYLVPDIGACFDCPFNTKANAPLFSDLEMGEATCTNGDCFAAKTAGWVQIELRKAGQDESAKPKVLVPRLSWKISSVKPSVVPNDGIAACSVNSAAETANPAKVLKQGQWVEAKRGSCSNVRPGVTVDWSDAADRGYMGNGKKLRKPGEVLQVCIAAGCKAHRKDWEKPKGTGSTGVDTPENKAKLEAEQKLQAEYVAAEMPVRVAVYTAVRAKIKPGMKWLRALLTQTVPNWQAVNLCTALGVQFKATGESWEMRNAAEKAIKQHIASVPDEELEKIAWDFQAVQAVRVDAGKHKRVADDRRDLWKIAKSCNVDPDAIAATFAPVKAAAKKVAAKKTAAKKAAKPVKKVVAKKAAAGKRVG